MIFKLLSASSPWLLVAIFVAGTTMGGVVATTVSGWRFEAKIEKLKAEREKVRADRASEALNDIAVASKAIKEQAVSNRLNVSKLNTTLDRLRKDFNDEKVKPLPVDCLPDSARVRKLAKTIDAVNQSISGRELGGTMSEDPKAKK